MCLALPLPETLGDQPTTTSKLIFKQSGCKDLRRVLASHQMDHEAGTTGIGMPESPHNSRVTGSAKSALCSSPRVHSQLSGLMSRGSKQAPNILQRGAWLHSQIFFLLPQPLRQHRQQVTPATTRKMKDPRDLLCSPSLGQQQGWKQAQIQTGHVRDLGHRHPILEYGSYSKSLKKESLSLPLKLSILLRGSEPTLHVHRAVKF